MESQSRYGFVHWRDRRLLAPAERPNWPQCPDKNMFRHTEFAAVDSRRFAETESPVYGAAPKRSPVLRQNTPSARSRAARDRDDGPHEAPGPWNGATR